MSDTPIPLDLQRLALVIGMDAIEKVSLQQQLDHANEVIRQMQHESDESHYRDYKQTAPVGETNR